MTNMRIVVKNRLESAAARIDVGVARLGYPQRWRGQSLPGRCVAGRSANRPRGSSALWAGLTDGIEAPKLALAGHGLRDHRADSAAYGRTGSGGGLTDGE
jgi:hypothetical protein